MHSTETGELELAIVKAASGDYRFLLNLIADTYRWNSNRQSIDARSALQEAEIRRTGDFPQHTILPAEMHVDDFIEQAQLLSLTEYVNCSAMQLMQLNTRDQKQVRSLQEEIISLSGTLMDSNFLVRIAESQDMPEFYLCLAEESSPKQVTLQEEIPGELLTDALKENYIPLKIREPSSRYGYLPTISKQMERVAHLKAITSRNTTLSPVTLEQAIHQLEKEYTDDGTGFMLGTKILHVPTGKAYTVKSYENAFEQHARAMVQAGDERKGQILYAMGKSMIYGIEPGLVDCFAQHGIYFIYKSKQGESRNGAILAQIEGEEGVLFAKVHEDGDFSHEIHGNLEASTNYFFGRDKYLQDLTVGAPSRNAFSGTEHTVSFQRAVNLDHTMKIYTFDSRHISAQEELERAVSKTTATEDLFYWIDACARYSVFGSKYISQIDPPAIIFPSFTQLYEEITCNLDQWIDKDVLRKLETRYDAGTVAAGGSCFGHRDLKPDNRARTTDGKRIILDNEAVRLMHPHAQLPLVFVQYGVFAQEEVEKYLGFFDTVCANYQQQANTQINYEPLGFVDYQNVATAFFLRELRGLSKRFSSKDEAQLQQSLFTNILGIATQEYVLPGVNANLSREELSSSY